MKTFFSWTNLINIVIIFLLFGGILLKILCFFGLVQVIQTPFYYFIIGLFLMGNISLQKELINKKLQELFGGDSVQNSAKEEIWKIILCNTDNLKKLKEKLDNQTTQLVPKNSAVTDSSNFNS